METHERQLPIPPAAIDDPKALELARIWAARGKQHVVLATELWGDPGIWGIALVDMARHIAHSYELTNGLDRSTTLQRIKAAFDDEWHKHTSAATGKLM